MSEYRIVGDELMPNPVPLRTIAGWQDQAFGTFGYVTDPEDGSLYFTGGTGTGAIALTDYMNLDPNGSMVIQVTVQSKTGSFGGGGWSTPLALTARGRLNGVLGTSSSPVFVSASADVVTNTFLITLPDTSDEFYITAAKNSSSGSIEAAVYSFSVRQVMISTDNVSDLLSLEIEQNTVGTINLVQNPSGGTGAWGWVTPVTGSTLEGGTEGLLYRAKGGTANYLYTEPLPVTPGQYIYASWLMTYSAIYYRAKIEFLDSGLSVVSSSRQTAYATSPSPAKRRGLLYAEVIPAGAAYARLRFDQYSNTSGGNPGDGWALLFQDVTVATAASAASLSPYTRINLLPNPSFETNTTGWLAQSGSPTLARVTSQAQTGSASLRLTAGTAGNKYAITTDGTGGFPVVAGKQYVASIYSKANTTARSFGIGISWFNAAGTKISDTAGFSVTNNNSTWTRTFTTAQTAPALAVTGSLFIFVNSMAVSEQHFFDAAMIEEASSVAAYFDGSTAAAGSIAYGWSGDANASSSYALDGSLLALLDPVQYENILGPTHQIDIVRDELDVGTLTVEILDVDLDPAVADTVRPGRRVRVMAYQNGYSDRQPLFVGKITNGKVNYHLDRTDSKASRVTLTAVDNVAVLSGTGRQWGVDTIADLPYVLEGVGVPWVCDGYSGQISSPTVVNKNENASALDQVAITRDSKHGYAWVDHHGTLRAYSPSMMPKGAVINAPALDFERADTTSFWDNGGVWTLARNVTAANVSSGQASLQATTTGTHYLDARTFIPVDPAGEYTFTAKAKASTTGITCEITLDWYDADRVLVDSTNAPATSVSNSGFTTLSVTGSALDAGVPDATYLVMSLLFIKASGSYTVYVDDASLVGPPVTVGEETYSDISIDFDTDRCINEVVVRWQRYSSGESEEIVYGPFRDQSSVDTWGVHRAEFTIQGSDIDATDAETFADEVFAVSGTPTLRANFVRVPITNGVLFDTAFADLYDRHVVSNAMKDYAKPSWLTKITHHITPSGWLVDFEYANEGGVAPPQVIPPPPPTFDPALEGVEVKVGSGGAPAFQNSWVNYGGVYAEASYVRRNGRVFLEGLVKNGTVSSTGVIFTLPVGYRPAAGHTVFATISNAAIGRCSIFSDGTVVAYSGNNAWFSLSGISFEIGG